MVRVGDCVCPAFDFYLGLHERDPVSECDSFQQVYFLTYLHGCILQIVQSVDCIVREDDVGFRCLLVFIGGGECQRSCFIDAVTRLDFHPVEVERVGACLQVFILNRGHDAVFEQKLMITDGYFDPSEDIELAGHDRDSRCVSDNCELDGGCRRITGFVAGFDGQSALIIEHRS